MSFKKWEKSHSVKSCIINSKQYKTVSSSIYFPQVFTYECKIPSKRSRKIHSKQVTVVIFERIGLGGKPEGLLTSHSHSFTCTCLFVFPSKSNYCSIIMFSVCFGHWRIRDRERLLQRQRKRERREKRREGGMEKSVMLLPIMHNLKYIQKRCAIWWLF